MQSNGCALGSASWKEGRSVFLFLVFVWSADYFNRANGGTPEKASPDRGPGISAELEGQSRAARSPAHSSRYPYSRWMATSDATRFLTPAQFCFPGTHNSGAYQSPELGPIVSRDRLAVSRARFLPRHRSAALRWSVTQPGSNILLQLMHGARYLDLRVAAYTDRSGETTYYLANTYAMSLLKDALRDILEFVNKHSTELVMVAVRPTYQINDHALMSVMERYLGKWMYPNAAGNSTFSHTVSEILKSGKRIIGVYKLQPVKLRTKSISQRWFLHDELFFNPHIKLTASARTVAGRQAYLKQQLVQFANWTATARTRSRKMFLLRYTLLHGRTIMSSSQNSLMTLASRMNPTLQDFIVIQLNQSQRAVISVITLDHFTASKAVLVAHHLLQERTAALNPSTKKPIHNHIPPRTTSYPFHKLTNPHDSVSPSSPTAIAQQANTTKVLAGSGLVVALLVVVYYLKLQ